jgi:hypothetical protein
MIHLQTYPNAAAYFQSANAFLSQYEHESNLILGAESALLGRTEWANFDFLNVLDAGNIRLSGLKNPSKLILVGENYQPEHLKKLADFYPPDNNPLKGLVAARPLAEAFLEACGYAHYPKKVYPRWLQSVEILNPAPKISGSLQGAITKDLELLEGWTSHFLEETNLPKQSPNDTAKTVYDFIQTGKLFKWMQAGEAVCMGALVRTTANVGWIGLVYTPPEHRNKGLAGALTHALSQKILKNGLQSSALFSDVSNPASNAVYKKIGYRIRSEFVEYIF